MTDRLATVTPQSPTERFVPPTCDFAMNAACYHCGLPLAIYGWRHLPGVAERMYIAKSLIRRESLASGLARFGRRNPNHPGPRHEPPAWEDSETWEKPLAAFNFYANCPSCDRGQTVTSPALAIQDTGVLPSS